MTPFANFEFLRQSVRTPSETFFQGYLVCQPDVKLVSL